MQLTSPEEFRVAVTNRWKTIAELKAAVQRNEARVLQKDKVGAQLYSLL